jgi:hypothetical protein
MTETKTGSRIPLTAICHERLGKHIEPGQSVIDATTGNGYDTEFLASLVGPDGRVFGFDIQMDAIDNTRQRLSRNDFLDRCSLHHAGHENMSQYLPPEVIGNVSTIVFNLGYLPGDNKTCVTSKTTTLQAIKQSLEILAENGMLSIMAYPGHPEGRDEADAVAQWVQSLDKRQHRVERLASTGSGPVLYIIQLANNL